MRPAQLTHSRSSVPGWRLSSRCVSPRGPTGSLPASLAHCSGRPRFCHGSRRCLVEVLAVLQVVGVLAAVGAVAGWRVRRTFPVAWLMLLVLAGLRGSFGKVLHNDVLVLLAAVPVMFAPGDARLGDRRASARWGWPVRCALAVVALVYFACGAQKLRNTGLASGHGRQHAVDPSSGRRRRKGATPVIAEFIAARAWLAHSVAGGVLALELSAPLLLAYPRARCLFVASTALLHLGTWLTLGLDYWGWILTVAVIALPSATIVSDTKVIVPPASSTRDTHALCPRHLDDMTRGVKARAPAGAEVPAE